jgi:transcriptional regulator with XRE-family HTH domain
MGAKNHKKILATIATNIREIRLAKGMTQKQVADRMYRDKQAVQKLETGNINPRYTTLIEIADALGVSVSDILKGTI